MSSPVRNRWYSSEATTLLNDGSESMPVTTTNVVNLDALITRADLAAPGEAGEDITSLPIIGLEKRGFLYPALRKPDFQRETASWSPEQVADLVATFARRDLIPAVILWRAGRNVFVIDGAHRLSALIAWVHDDYGDGEASRRFFQNVIPADQQSAAEKARKLIQDSVGSYDDHKFAVEFPARAREDVRERATRLGWQDIPAQWIRNADHDKAENSFFRINQGGTKIDPTEKKILNARRTALALSSRAIVRGGTGHGYWDKFGPETQDKVEDLGREIHETLFKPVLDLPIKTLDVPMAGLGYGPHVLPFVFDLVALVTDAALQKKKRRATDEDLFPEDEDGSETIRFLTKVRELVWRLCSVHPSSLGLHPALYFYSPGGVFQPGALLSVVALFRNWDTKEFKEFTSLRSRFEAFLLEHRGITEAIRKLGSGNRSRPRVTAFYRAILDLIREGKSTQEIHATLLKNAEFAFMFTIQPDVESASGKFTRDVKGGAFLRDALPTAPKCFTCGGILHKNGMQAGHREHRRDGGSGTMANAKMQHPFCNSTVAQ